jgi:RecB family exonuclease
VSDQVASPPPMPEPPVDWRDLPAVDEADQPVVAENWTPSQTFLKLHDRCDRAAMLYLTYRAGAGGQELNRGAIWHEVAAALTRYAINRPDPEPRIGSPEIAKDFLLEYMRENPHLQVSAVERDALRYMISNFAMGETWDPHKVVAVETTVTIEIGPYRVICRIDRAEDRGRGRLGVVDYKTSFAMADSDDFKPPSEDEEGKSRFAGDFQTMLYALALAEGTLDDGDTLGDGYEFFDLELKYPRYLRPEGLGRRKVTVSRVQLLDFKLDVEEQLRRLEVVNLGERKWQPTPGSVCRECPAEYACPLPKLLRPESQHADLDSIEDLEKAGAAWLFMTKRASNLKSRLKKAAERLGDENPALLELPDGDKGVYIGDDLALIFIPKETETIKDKAELAEAVERAVKYGEHFDMAEHVRRSESTSFEKRKVARKSRNGDTNG